MALLSGEHVVGVSLLNSLPYYILENNASSGYNGVQGEPPEARKNFNIFIKNSIV